MKVEYSEKRLDEVLEFQDMEPLFANFYQTDWNRRFPS